MNLLGGLINACIFISENPQFPPPPPKVFFFLGNVLFLLPSSVWARPRDRKRPVWTGGFSPLRKSLPYSRVQPLPIRVQAGLSRIDNQTGQMHEEIWPARPRVAQLPRNAVLPQSPTDRPIFSDGQRLECPLCCIDWSNLFSAVPRTAVLYCRGLVRGLPCSSRELHREIRNLSHGLFAGWRL